MSKAWPHASIGSVAKPIERLESPQSGKTYRQIGVRLWGQGAYERESIDGSETKYKTLNQVKAGDIIVNKIWARNGSVSIVSSELEGCYCSGEFPIFEPIPTQLDPQWFYWITKARWFWERCDAQSRGTSGKNRIRPEKFMAIQIPLPPLAEQQRIVAKIERLAGKIEEARELRKQAIAKIESLVSTELHAIFNYLTRKHGNAKLEQLITEASYGTSEKCSPIRNEGALPILRIPNVASEKINLDDLKFANLSTRNYENLLLKNGDILVVRTNGSLDLVGRCAVVAELPEPTAFASYMIRLRLNHKTINPTYTQRMLRYLRISGQLTNFARTTAGQYNVSLGRLRAAEIPVPPIAEQLKIVTELDNLQYQINRLKTIQAQTTAEFDAMLPSILDKAFKGEL